MKSVDYEIELSLMQLRARKRRRRLIAGLLLWCLVLWILFHQLFGISVIDGNSMRPSFYAGDVVIYRRGMPKELTIGDIVIIHSWLDQDKDYIKRIAGLPGDIVEVDEKGYLIRNGEPARENEVLHGYQQSDSDVTYPYRVPDEAYFCLGDNRPVSLDSRTFGPLKENQILGKVIAVFRFHV